MYIYIYIYIYLPRYLSIIPSSMCARTTSGAGLCCKSSLPRTHDFLTTADRLRHCETIALRGSIQLLPVTNHSSLLHHSSQSGSRTSLSQKQTPARRKPSISATPPVHDPHDFRTTHSLTTNTKPAGIIPRRSYPASLDPTLPTCLPFFLSYPTRTQERHRGFVHTPLRLPPHNNHYPTNHNHIITQQPQPQQQQQS